VVMPPESLGAWGSGLPAMLLMLAIGVPMYICATASTPLAASLLVAGVSPGTVLVFLLAGPATNIGTLGIVRRELGTPAAAGYLGAIALVSVGAGLLTDLLVRAWALQPAAQAAQAHGVIPHWLAVASTLAMLALSARWAWRGVRAAWQNHNQPAEQPREPAATSRHG